MSKSVDMIKACALASIVLASAGCGRSITDTPGDAPNLVEWVAQVRARPAPPLDPIPVIKPFESFQFDGRGFRDPFDVNAVESNGGGMRSTWSARWVEDVRWWRW